MHISHNSAPGGLFLAACKRTALSLPHCAASRVDMGAY
jgi:hypothetical protein